MPKIDFYDCVASIILLCAASMRVILAALGWPPTNSDEGTMAIMALNIAYQGAHPLMFYGQDYMGTIEAYLGAGFFHLFGGPSLFALRLGVIVLVIGFFICLYLLARLLFSRSLAVVTLLLLSVGSIPMLTRQMIATGGSSQTLFFGSLAFLLASWLAMTYKRTVTAPEKNRAWLRNGRDKSGPSKCLLKRDNGYVKFLTLWMKMRRLVAYAIWGLAVGLGLWSDMVVLPFLAMAGLLLLIYCWRELLTWAWLIVFLCIIIGALPQIIYDLAHHLTPWNILFNLAQGSNATAPRTLSGILHNITSTLLVSIPTATGNPFCPVNELRFLGDNAPHSLPCTFIHASWGCGYLLLLAYAISTNIWEMKHHPLSKEEAVRHLARLFLLGGAVLAICIYTFSSGPVDQPAFHARYLVSLLIATPALIAPLWNKIVTKTLRNLLPHYNNLPHCNNLRNKLRGRDKSGPYGIRAMNCAYRINQIFGLSFQIRHIFLTIIFSCYFIGTIIAFSEVPATRRENQQRQDLIHHLIDLGVTRFYSNYWTCYNLIFASDEHVICAIIGPDLQPTHNRAPRYLTIVQADPRTAFVLPMNTSILPANDNDLPAVEHMIAQAGSKKYQRYLFDGYVVYVEKSGEMKLSRA